MFRHEFFVDSMTFEPFFFIASNGLTASVDLCLYPSRIHSCWKTNTNGTPTYAIWRNYILNTSRLYTYFLIHILHIWKMLKWRCFGMIPLQALLRLERVVHAALWWHLWGDCCDDHQNSGLGRPRAMGRRWWSQATSLGWVESASQNHSLHGSGTTMTISFVGPFVFP